MKKKNETNILDFIRVYEKLSNSYARSDDNLAINL